VDVVESWQRSNQPVVVFGSLLGQRQFTAADFALDALNHPDATDNFRAALMVEQTVVGGATKAAVAAAEVGRAMTTTHRTMVGLDLAAGVTAAYGRALAAAANNRSAAAAVEAVQADRDLAASRRDAGLVTDADVLQIDVYLSQAREQLIRAGAEERIARAQLNQLMGEPLDTEFVLDAAVVPPALDTGALATLEEEALAHRPDVRLAALQEQLADSTRTAARAAFLPQVAVQGGWELNGGTWTNRESSWAVGLVARINVFNGFADRARLAEVREQATRRSLEREKTETAARLDVRVALARLEAARASAAVGRASVEQARASQRIIRDRYEAGLTDVASLLRAAEAVAQADAQQIAAQAAILIESAALERSLGRQ
jgi:outer membrane protein TolC